MPTVLISPSHEEWLRTFPLFASFGESLDSEEVVHNESVVPELDIGFWTEQTYAVEAFARKHLSEREIDFVFDRTTQIIDEDLLRFDPMIHYFAEHFPDGDPARIEIEREIAFSAKRDLAWMTVEVILGEPQFFVSLRPCYEAGRWPHGWQGVYPSGKLIVT